MVVNQKIHFDDIFMSFDRNQPKLRKSYESQYNFYIERNLKSDN